MIARIKGFSVWITNLKHPSAPPHNYKNPRLFSYTRTFECTCIKIASGVAKISIMSHCNVKRLAEISLCMRFVGRAFCHFSWSFWSRPSSAVWTFALDSLVTIEDYIKGTAQVCSLLFATKMLFWQSWQCAQGQIRCCCCDWSRSVFTVTECTPV